MDWTPVVVIGAPRSGTNMLRDVLCSLDGLGTWPCDEINLIWRYGHPDWPTDELPPTLATKDVRQYIRDRFAHLARRFDLRTVVEKTCANSLRVPYVDAVLPEARYIWIYRDPLDCVASAVKRWGAPFDVHYTLRKARYAPVSDLPTYGWRFVRNRLSRITSGQGRVASWGPVFDGMAEALDDRDLVDVCALQWRACIEKSAQAFSSIPTERWMPVSYEAFVRDPIDQLGNICEFVAESVAQEHLADAVRDVSTRSIGRGRDEIGPQSAARVERLVAPATVILNHIAQFRERR